MATNKNFEYLGNNFQIQLLNQIIVDKDFSLEVDPGDAGVIDVR